MEITLKEMTEKKIMTDSLLSLVFFGGNPDYEEYKKYLTKDEFDKIVKKAKWLANIQEEDWSEDNE